jgi:hypothetical protein
MDLARAFGAPRFDERSHGLHRERHPVRFLLASAARLPLAGGLVLALLFVWAGAAWAPRRISDATVGAPTLDEFVDSLARLYAGTGDYARVLERYRELTAARLRRHFGLAAEIPLSELIDRVARGRRVDRAALARLAGGAAPADAAGLRAAVRRLDALVAEAVR